MSLVVITPPASFVELERAKLHLRVDDGSEDDLIQGYIDAACASLDGPQGSLQRAIGQQTLELRLDGFDAADWRVGGGYAWSGGWSAARWASWPFARIKLPCPPLLEVFSITFEDGIGVDQVLAPTGWQVDDSGVEPAFGASWPAGRIAADAVRIQYRAGYETPPAPLVHAILLMVGDAYLNRESQLIGTRAAAVQNPAVDRLLGPFQVYV